MSRYILSLILLATFAYGQKAPAPVFEVVSVKPALPGGGDSVLHVEPDRVHCKCLLNQMIQNAYEIRLSRIVAPSWVLDPSTAKNIPFVYELDARFPAAVGTAQVPAMMRQMLADRFHLTAHRETRDEPVYILSIAESGLKLKPSPPEPPADPAAPPARKSLFVLDAKTGEIHVHGAMSLAKLAFFLGSDMDREVIDRTNRDEQFDIVLNARIPVLRAPLPGSILPRQSLDASESPDALPSIMSEIRTVGLRLEPGRAPVEHLVIDHIESTPTPN